MRSGLLNGDIAVTLSGQSYLQTRQYFVNCAAHFLSFELVKPDNSTSAHMFTMPLTSVRIQV